MHREKWVNVYFSIWRSSRSHCYVTHTTLTHTQLEAGNNVFRGRRDATSQQCVKFSWPLSCGLWASFPFWTGIGATLAVLKRKLPPWVGRGHSGCWDLRGEGWWHCGCWNGVEGHCWMLRPIWWCSGVHLVLENFFQPWYQLCFIIIAVSHSTVGQLTQVLLRSNLLPLTWFYHGKDKVWRHGVYSIGCLMCKFMASQKRLTGKKSSRVWSQNDRP